MKAAVLHEVGESKIEVRDDVSSIPTPAHSVKVKIHATGVCHSDLHAIDGTVPQMLPAILGHEGAGEVIEVGSLVEDLAIGDHVIVNWLPSCGKCRYCLNSQPYLCMVYTLKSFTEHNFLAGDTPAFGMAGTGTFAEEVVLPRPGVVKIPNDVPYDVASLIGCGIMTGVGAAINTAKVTPGSKVLVIGCGGVGISVIQGARIAGAAEIVAVDMLDKKLEWAKQFGATHAVTPDGLSALMGELTEWTGFDYVFDVVGRAATIRQGYDNTARGGKLTIVGVGPATEQVTFSPFELLFSDKTILGSVYGGGHPERDFPRLIALWKAGRLDLEGMITRRISIEEINDAFDAMKAGEVIRQVIEL